MNQKPLIDNTKNFKALSVKMSQAISDRGGLKVLRVVRPEERKQK